MIITCEECKTKFNLDESLLKPDGSKVRCSACRHVFTAYPPSISGIEPPEPVNDLFMDTAEESQDFSAMDNELDFDDAFKTGNDLSIDDDLTIDTDLEFDGNLDLESDLEFNEDLELETSLEFDESVESDSDTVPESDDDHGKASTLPLFDDEPLEEIKIEEDDYGFDEIEASLIEEDMPEQEDRPGSEMSLELDVDYGSSSKKEDSSMEGIEDTEDDDLEEELDLSVFDEFLDEEKETEETSSLDSTDDSGIAPDTREEAEQTESANLSEEGPETVQDTRKRFDEEQFEEPLVSDIMSDFDRPQKKTSWLGRFFLILLFLAIILLSGYAICIMKGIQVPYISELNIPYVSEYIRSYAPKPAPVELSPDKKSVNGRFVTNQPSGTLFVITGTVTNHSAITCSRIRVQGSLITKNKVKSKTKTVFCGNVIPENTLKTVDIAAINELMARAEGNNQTNINITPGKSVPFMVVFDDLPENLQNFTVSVVGFEKEK